MKQRMLDTVCVQGAYNPKSGEARVCPVVKSTTFYYEKAQDMADLFDLKSEGFFYSRIGNPTLNAFEEKLALLAEAVEKAEVDKDTTAVKTAMKQAVSSFRDPEEVNKKAEKSKEMKAVATV